MEQNVNNKIEIKDKLKNFYNKNKFKIYTIVFVLISVFFVFIIYKVNLQKKNELISENYIKAGLYLNSGKKKESLDIYEKIILSGNKFYSILALSIILEKNLITDQKIILDYFLIITKVVVIIELIIIYVFPLVIVYFCWNFKSKFLLQINYFVKIIFINS